MAFGILEPFLPSVHCPLRMHYCYFFLLSVALRLNVELAIDKFGVLLRARLYHTDFFSRFVFLRVQATLRPCLPFSLRSGRISPMKTRLHA